MRWIAALYRRWRDRPDPAWAPTGFRQTYAGFDESKAVNAAKRAAELAERQKHLAVQRGGMRRRKPAPVVTPERDNVSPFPGRRAAGR